MGDWLAFVGALVGVIVTILGTLAIENARGRAEETRNRKTLLRSLADMDRAMSTLEANRDGLAPKEAKIQLVAAERHLLRELDKFIYARHYVPKNHVDAWYAVETLQSEWTKQRPTLENELRILEEDQGSPIVFAIHITKIAAAIETMRPYLEAAKSEVSREL